MERSRDRAECLFDSTFALHTDAPRQLKKSGIDTSRRFLNLYAFFSKTQSFFRSTEWQAGTLSRTLDHKQIWSILRDCLLKWLRSFLALWNVRIGRHFSSRSKWFCRSFSFLFWLGVCNSSVKIYLLLLRRGRYSNPLQPQFSSDRVRSISKMKLFRTINHVWQIYPLLLLSWKKCIKPWRSNDTSAKLCTRVTFITFVGDRE